VIRFSWALRFLTLLAAIAVSNPAWAASDSANVASGKPLEILRITPEGDDVPAANQIVITFDRPVVAIGKMERANSEIPIVIKPAVQCEWRWINTSSLACNLPDKAPLQPATRYSLDINPGIASQDGASLSEVRHHTFLTERPNLDDNEFRVWKSPSLPVLRLAFNQPVDQQSVANHVYFAMGEKGETRIALKVSPDPEDRVLPQIMPIPGEKGAIVLDKSQPQKSNDQLQTIAGREARRVWLVEPANELPADSNVTLRVEPGLMSALGPELSASSNDLVTFDTFPDFEFLGVRCTDNSNAEIFTAMGEVPKGKCNPLQPVRLSFSAPVEREQLGDVLTFNPPIGGWKALVAEDQQQEAEQTQAPEVGGKVGIEYRQYHAKGRTYDIWLPTPLKAAQSYSVTSKDPASVKDVFGRASKQPISQSFELDHRNPNFVLDYTDAVLEKNVASEVPLYVNNLQNFSFDYRRLTPNGADAARSVSQTIPSVTDVQFAMPLNVRSMLDGGTGAVYGALKTIPKVGGDTPPKLFAQVTPFQVHLKLGHFNTIAWVTDMATGAPVAGAKVSLYKDALTTMHVVTDVTASALTDEGGLATLPGTDTLDPDLTITEAYGDEKTRYFLRVDKGGDMALLPISQSYIIDSYRSSGSESVYPSNRERYGHMRAWGTTAQGIYRAGDLVQYKIFVRDQSNDAFIPPPEKGYRLKIIDPTGKVVQDIKTVELSAFGGLTGEFTAPKEGAVGWYKFKLIAKFAQSSPNDDSDDEAAPVDDQGNSDSGDQPQVDDSVGKKSWIAMRVLVSDFTPAPFKVSNQLNGDLFHAGDQVEVTTHAELFSGGVYTDASARITAILDASTFASTDPVAKDFSFDSYKDEEASTQIFQKMDVVDNKGELTLNFTTGTPKVVYGKLMVESAVADDRGKYVTSQAHADFIGVDRLVGLFSKDWLLNVGKSADIQYIVVDEHGKPASGSNVDVRIEHETTKGARVKGAGNAYLTEYHTEWEAAGACQGVSTDAPLTCTFTPTKSGSYRAVAVIKDTKGNEHTTTLSTYAVGNDYVMWDNGSDSSLSVIPQSTDYKVGDTARYLVKNPYPGARALITIERFGVLDHFVQTFDSSTPIVEFKVKPDYLPGFYLSVVIISPRVEQPLGEGQVDLGKPTFRMGYVTVPVSDPYKEMLITAKADKDVYKRQ
jgi:alpha-2-macroglobulin